MRALTAFLVSIAAESDIGLRYTTLTQSNKSVDYIT